MVGSCFVLGMFVLTCWWLALVWMVGGLVICCDVMCLDGLGVCPYHLAYLLIGYIMWSLVFTLVDLALVSTWCWMVVLVICLFILGCTLVPCLSYVHSYPWYAGVCLYLG
jgi:hypothetical protein